jgi:hypothetical protein
MNELFVKCTLKIRYVCCKSFDTMERVRTAKEEQHYFPKSSNQPAMVEQPIRLRYGYKINAAMLLLSKRLGIELGE